MKDMPHTLGGILAHARRYLFEGGAADPAFDARVLVSGLLGLSLTDIVLRPDLPVSAAQASVIENALKRRNARESVHRILGHREFHGLTLSMSHATLEPRPDTEILIDTLLPHLLEIIRQRDAAHILDLGTGTGAICLALLAHCRKASGVGSDISSKALETARANANANGLADRFRTVESHWFDKIEGRFDIIVSNPPYIPTDIVAGLDDEVKNFDPALALDGGEDGLDAYRAIADRARYYLSDEGIVGLETGFDQKDAVTSLFLNRGFAFVEAIKDYGGNHRVLIFK